MTEAKVLIAVNDLFDVVPNDAIKSGEATDTYFERTEQTLQYAERNPTVVAELTADQFPTGEFEVLAGVKDAAHLLEGRDLDVDALREGQLFDGGPVFRIEGPYLEFARLETSLLGFLSHQSAIATNALEIRRAAPETQVLSFGARHVHPSIAAIVERGALLGGLDGFSHTTAGDVIGRDASGTMSHALMLCYGRGEQQAAWQAYNEAVDTDVSRIALCDTFADEVEEVRQAVDALGSDLNGVRLDTTKSRRGDFKHIVREVRWELRETGREDIDIFVSGGLTPEDLRMLSGVADGFGVGGYISNADPIDFALDIVEIEGKPISKRGKLPGEKEVYRTADGNHCVNIADMDSPAEGDPLLEPLLREGKLVREFDLDDAATRALADAETVGFKRRSAQLEPQ